MASTIVGTIIETLGEFVTGLGGAFQKAFQVVFMNETVVDGVTHYEGISNLGIFILCAFGLTLGYGIIRWTTGLFQSKTR